MAHRVAPSITSYGNWIPLLCYIAQMLLLFSFRDPFHNHIQILFLVKEKVLGAITCILASFHTLQNTLLQANNTYSWFIYLQVGKSIYQKQEGKYGRMKNLS